MVGGRKELATGAGVVVQQQGVSERVIVEEVVRVVQRRRRYQRRGRVVLVRERFRVNWRSPKLGWSVE